MFQFPSHQPVLGYVGAIEKIAVLPAPELGLTTKSAVWRRDGSVGERIALTVEGCGADVVEAQTHIHHSIAMTALLPLCRMCRSSANSQRGGSNNQQRGFGMNTSKTRRAESLYSNAIVSVLGILKAEAMLFYIFIPTGETREVWLPKRTCSWDADLSCVEIPKLVAMKASLWPVEDELELTLEERTMIQAHREYTRTHA